MDKDKGDKIVHLKKPEVKEDTLDTYSNQVNMSVSVYDFILQFGQMTPPEDTPKLKAIIRMSPQHTKVLSLLLNKNIKQYEKDIGQINLPKNLLKELGLEKES